MFLNLKAEMVRRQWKMRDLAKASGISTPSLSQKMNGLRDFKRGEMIAIRGALGCEDLTLDFLFEEAPEK